MCSGLRVRKQVRRVASPTSGTLHLVGGSGIELQLSHCRKERTPPEVREQRERERELRELDRDIRTVFAFNLPLKADERNLFEFFSKAGQVEDVRIIKDRNTNKSKGFAYIEYTNRVRPAQPIWQIVSAILTLRRGCGAVA